MWRAAAGLVRRGLRVPVTRGLSGLGGRVPAASNATLHFSNVQPSQSLAPVRHVWWPDVIAAGHDIPPTPVHGWLDGPAPMLHAIIGALAPVALGVPCIFLAVGLTASHT